LLWQWRPKNSEAEPFIDADPKTLLPLLRMIQKAGGNDAEAVLYPDPPGGCRRSPST
jgi:hypothetical protein